MRLFFVTPTTWTQVPNPLPFPLRQGWTQALLAIKISALASPPIQNSHKRHRNPQFEVAKSPQPKWSKIWITLPENLQKLGIFSPQTSTKSRLYNPSCTFGPRQRAHFRWYAAANGRLRKVQISGFTVQGNSSGKPFDYSGQMQWL